MCKCCGKTKILSGCVDHWYRFEAEIHSFKSYFLRVYLTCNQSDKCHSGETFETFIVSGPCNIMCIKVGCQFQISQGYYLDEWWAHALDPVEGSICASNIRSLGKVVLLNGYLSHIVHLHKFLTLTLIQVISLTAYFWFPWKSLVQVTPSGAYSSDVLHCRCFKTPIGVKPLLYSFQTASECSHWNNIL